MARRTHAFVLAALLLAAGSAHAQSVPKDAIPDDATLAPSTTSTGLNLVQSVNGVGAFSGRALSDSTAAGNTFISLLASYTDADDGWSDTITTVNTNGDTVNGLVGAVSIASKVTDTLMQKYMWLADTAGQTVYKIDTTLGGANSVVGAYAAKPSISAGNPVAFTVLSNGDAFVGNAFTFGTDEIGSLTKIQADNTKCGAAGAATTPGTTSTGISDVLGWTSTTTAMVDDGQGGQEEVIVGAYADNADACVKGWVDLGSVDPDANTVSVAAVGSDGYDRVYTLAVNEATRFAGFLKLYRALPDGTGQEILVDTYEDFNQIVNVDGGTGKVISATSDGPGAPGGSGLVVDKWGYLWSGGGTYIKDFGGATGRKHMVIRFNTEDPSMGFQYFPVDHETNALALANDGNLWVSGAAGMSLIQIDPLATGVGGEFTPDSIGTSTLLTPGAAAIDLVAAQGGASEAVCNLDNCCEEGGYNTGIAVTRATGDVFVTNECPTGKVLRFTAAGSLVAGGAIDIGSFPSGINADALDNIWVPILVTTGADETEARATQLMKIAAGTNTATQSAEIAKPYLGGIGDMTGRDSAQPPQLGSWTWIHDTTYPDYSKWDGGSARWTATNITTYPDFNNPDLNVEVSVADALAGPWSDPQAVGTGTFTTLGGLGGGRYVKFVADFTRGDKRAPEIGPQAYGLMPLLTKFELIPANQYPTAICQEKTVNADNPTDQTNSVYGTNANGRMCGAVLDATTAVDNGSHDPDTAELDSIIPIQPTSAFYSPTLYKLTSAAQPWTESTLTVTDAHGGSNQCSERVNIQDVSPPYWKSQFNLRNATAPLTSALSDISTLCIWPPNFKYYCWLDVTSNDNDQIIPLYDNCGGSIPMGKQADQFVCEDSDPRTQPGDCVIYQQGTGPTATYNMCVKAQRRTVYTNTARVYQANFKVTDGSAPDIGSANTFSRKIKIPPLWNFQTSGDCPRPTYKAPAGTLAYYTNEARK